MCAGSVFCVSLHPLGELACSGGEDDKAYVWKVADGTTKFLCEGTSMSNKCMSHSSLLVQLVLYRLSAVPHTVGELANGYINVQLIPP